MDCRLTYKLLCRRAEGDSADQAHQGQQDNGGETQTHPQAALFQQFLSQVQITHAQTGTQNDDDGGDDLQKTDAGGGRKQLLKEKKDFALDLLCHEHFKLTVTVIALCHT